MKEIREAIDTIRNNKEIHPTRKVLDAEKTALAALKTMEWILCDVTDVSVKECKTKFQEFRKTP